MEFRVPKKEIRKIQRGPVYGALTVIFVAVLVLIPDYEGGIDWFGYFLIFGVGAPLFIALTVFNVGRSVRALRDSAVVVTDRGIDLVSAGVKTTFSWEDVLDIDYQEKKFGRDRLMVVMRSNSNIDLSMYAPLAQLNEKLLNDFKSYKSR